MIVPVACPPEQTVDMVSEYRVVPYPTRSELPVPGTVCLLKQGTYLSFRLGDYGFGVLIAVTGPIGDLHTGLDALDIYVVLSQNHHLLCGLQSSDPRSP